MGDNPFLERESSVAQPEARGLLTDCPDSLSGRAAEELRGSRMLWAVKRAEATPGPLALWPESELLSLP